MRRLEGAPTAHLLTPERLLWCGGLTKGGGGCEVAPDPALTPVSGSDILGKISALKPQEEAPP